MTVSNGSSASSRAACSRPDSTACRTASSAASAIMDWTTSSSAQTMKAGSMPASMALALSSDAQKLWMVEILASGSLSRQSSRRRRWRPLLCPAISPRSSRTRCRISRAAFSVNVMATNVASGLSWSPLPMSSCAYLVARTSVLPQPAPLSRARLSAVRSIAADRWTAVRFTLPVMSVPPERWPSDRAAPG